MWVAASAATHKDRCGLKSVVQERDALLGEMYYQLSWTTLPGLRGLSCSEFRAVQTATPEYERGVAIEFASEAECDALLAALEAHFGPQRFLNAAAAFDSVKDYVAQRSARR